MYMFPNHKKYVGKTKTSLAKRQGTNFCRYKQCTVLWNAIQKYGVENIDQVILVEADMEDYRAAEIEQAYIDLWHTNCCRYNNPSRGYNLTDGGEGTLGWKPDEEQYKKRCAILAESLEKRRGIPFSEEHRKNISRSKLGVKRGPMSEETKRKLSIANSIANSSPETRARKSEAQKKKMYVINEDTGDRLDFNSVSDTAAYFGVRTSTLHKWRTGKLKPPGNYTFHRLSTDND